MENAALQLQAAAQGEGVYEIAVMADGELALDMTDHHGLRIFPGHGTAGGIPHMADCHRGVRLSARNSAPCLSGLCSAADFVRTVIFIQLIQHLAAEHLMNQPEVLVTDNGPFPVDRNACGFLPAVLQRGQRAVGNMCDIRILRRPDPEDAAFLMNAVRLLPLLEPAFTESAARRRALPDTAMAGAADQTSVFTHQLSSPPQIPRAPPLPSQVLQTAGVHGSGGT